MALYFVPFGVGIMVSYGEIANNALAIGVALVVSTIAVIATVGAVFQLLNKSKQ
jgi:holin-like protein